MSPSVRHATIHDLERIAPLFDAYRVFYRQASDIAASTHFLRERFQHHDSVLLFAVDDDGEAAGFVQLYPLYSSVRVSRIYLLNDLFVAPGMRRRGVAAALLRAAEDFARGVGAIRLTLTTAHENTTAQRLYESLGWVLDTEFREYVRRL